MNHSNMCVSASCLTLVCCFFLIFVNRQYYCSFFYRFLHIDWSLIHKKLTAVEPPAPPEPQPEQLGLAEQVEQLRSAILLKVDAIRELQARLRTTCVPLSVCTYLSQCIKDTDVCMLIFRRDQERVLLSVCVYVPKIMKVGNFFGPPHIVSTSW